MIIVPGGNEKSGKTSFALTFPKPMAYFEFDIGGYGRAVRRVPLSEAELIQHRAYPLPLSLSFTRVVKADPYQPLQGYRELFEEFKKDYIEACGIPEIKTMVLDTGAMLTNISRFAYLQEKQERQLAKGKGNVQESLETREYGVPNSWLQALVYYAKGSGKDLVYISHLKDVYVSQLDKEGRIESVPNGEQKLSGWNDISWDADAIIRMTNGPDYLPVATIDPRYPCGLALELTGVELAEPTYDSLMTLVGAYQ